MARLGPPVLALGWALVLLSLGFGGAADAAPPKPAVHTVVIEGVKYEPEALTVARGDTIEWVNKDPFPHTVTSPGAFDSREIGAGKSWRYVARKAGDYAYVCTLHPNMRGTLVVK